MKTKFSAHARTHTRDKRKHSRWTKTEAVLPRARVGTSPNARDGSCGARSLESPVLSRRWYRSQLYRKPLLFDDEITQPRVGQGHDSSLINFSHRTFVLLDNPVAHYSLVSLARFRKNESSSVGGVWLAAIYARLSETTASVSRAQTSLLSWLSRPMSSSSLSMAARTVN